MVNGYFFIFVTQLKRDGGDNNSGKGKSGDAAAFSLLYDLYWLKVYNFARLYVTSSSVISEVVSGCFCESWESKEFLDITKEF